MESEFEKKHPLLTLIAAPGLFGLMFVSACTEEFTGVHLADDVIEPAAKMLLDLIAGVLLDLMGA